MPLNPVLANTGTHPTCESLLIEYTQLGLTYNPKDNT